MIWLHDVQAKREQRWEICGIAAEPDERLTEQPLEIVRARDTATLQYEILFNATKAQRS